MEQQTDARSSRSTANTWLTILDPSLLPVTLALCCKSLHVYSPMGQSWPLMGLSSLRNPSIISWKDKQASMSCIQIVPVTDAPP